MKGNPGEIIAALKRSYADNPRKASIMVRLTEEERDSLKTLAEEKEQPISDFVRDAIDFYAWALSPIELKVKPQLHDGPEYIDLINTAAYEIQLYNYLITDSTFLNGFLTDKLRHFFHFAAYTPHWLTGERMETILYPGETVRVYTRKAPRFPPRGISMWMEMGLKNNIWNSPFDEIRIYRIVREDAKKTFKPKFRRFRRR